MSTATPRRRRSDLPDFVEVSVDIDALADEIFARYAGEQDVVVEGARYTTTFFRADYCPDYRVMKLAGQLALAVNRRALHQHDGPDAVSPLRVTLREIMLAALLHDLGKQHEDCAPFLQLLQTTDLRAGGGSEAAQRREYLLGIVRDAHCRKGPCMIDRLRDAGHAELHNPFIATVARRHGDAYESNCSERQGCWWAREVNVVTIADDYDAMTSQGPERAYKPSEIRHEQAISLLRAGARQGRYEPRLTEIFITDVLGSDPPTRIDSRH